MTEWKISGTIIPPPGNNADEMFFDGDGNRADGSSAVFPIIQRNDDGPWLPIGTGFFIGVNGLFATARHVFAKNRSEEIYKNLYGVRIIKHLNKIEIREINHISLHPKSDVAIGFLYDKVYSEKRIRNRNKCFTLTQEIPTIGSEVVSYGFPKPIKISLGESGIIKYTAEMFAGVLEEIYPEGRDKVMLREMCFRTSIISAPGSSGSPVAFGDGKIFGIISTGYQDQPINFVSPITDILSLPVPSVKLPNGEITTSLLLQDLIQYNIISIDAEQ